MGDSEGIEADDDYDNVDESNEDHEEGIHFDSIPYCMDIFNIETYHNIHIHFILGGVSCPAGSRGNGGKSWRGE